MFISIEEPIKWYNDCYPLIILYLETGLVIHFNEYNELRVKKVSLGNRQVFNYTKLTDGNDNS